LEVFNDREKILETFKGLGEGIFADDLRGRIDNTIGEVIFRDVNTYVKHRLSPFSGFKYVPYSSLPCGKGFFAQPTYWELRDRGTDSFWGFKAQVKWSSCPSFFKTLQIMHSYIIN
jgi:hypothetical protein